MVHERFGRTTLLLLLAATVGTICLPILLPVFILVRSMKVFD